MTTLFVTYPGDAGTRFDRDYYVATHLPLVRDAWGPYGLETAEALFPPGEGAETIAVCVCQFRDEAAVDAALAAPQTAGVMADVRHFTDATPSQRRAAPLDAPERQAQGRPSIRAGTGGGITQQEPRGESGPRPFWADTPPTASRRGHFWVTAERVPVGDQAYQRGPMFVDWEAPERVTQPYPVVLVHGGTLQGTEWGATPDGRPGWAQRLVEAGYAVLVVDRPGHGRSPYHPDIIGPTGPPFSYARAREVYFPAAAGAQTQWPFDPTDDAAFDAFLAPYGPMPADLAASQDMDADRLARLLDRIGPAILVTHSASGPDGWLVADRRPGLVVAVVSVEPMGPPFAATPGIGSLDWGLTAAPVTYDPPRTTPAEVRAADPATLRIPALAGLPVAVVTGETSAFAAFGPAIVDFLVAAGAAAEQLHLPDHGVRGNGHGLIYERNSDEALAPVLRWLAAHAGVARVPVLEEAA